MVGVKQDASNRACWQVARRLYVLRPLWIRDQQGALPTFLGFDASRCWPGACRDMSLHSLAPCGRGARCVENARRCNASCMVQETSKPRIVGKCTTQDNLARHLWPSFAVDGHAQCLASSTHLVPPPLGLDPFQGKHTTGKGNLPI
jgi:hypothetical protein